MLDYNDLKMVKRLWEKHGGRQHGPNVETVTMPLENLRGFLEDFLGEMNGKDEKPEEHGDAFLDT